MKIENHNDKSDLGTASSFKEYLTFSKDFKILSYLCCCYSCVQEVDLRTEL